MKPICTQCRFYMAKAVEIKENKYRYLHKCLHYRVQFKEYGFGKLGVTKGFVPNRKTSPMWCPLRSEKA